MPVTFSENTKPEAQKPTASSQYKPIPASNAVIAPKQVRKWLTINPDGTTSSLELSKIRVHHQLGIQLRDLRLLDPLLATSYPSAILARDRALIVNLEFIKMIVSLDRVYVTNLDDPNTSLFVEELQRRLSHPTGSATAMGVSPSVADLASQFNTSVHDGGLNNLNSTTALIPKNAPTESQHPSHLPNIPHPHFEVLPFDLRVLECALDVVSGYLESQAGDLEAAAHPALDALTQKISTSNLERVRRIKNRMVRLMTKVETLKELLEKLLDDDNDMKDLNLSAKEQERQDMMERVTLRQSSSLTSQSTPFDAPISSSIDQTFSGPNRPDFASPLSGTRRHSQAASISSDLSDDEDVEVVEQLIESYFMINDNTWNKLQTLADYIEDTEDFINIELDSNRNQLIRIDLMLTSFTASVALITAVTSLFAMNVVLSPDIQDKAPFSWFLAISISTAVAAVLGFGSVIAYCRYKRLI